MRIGLLQESGDGGRRIIRRDEKAGEAKAVKGKLGERERKGSMDKDADGLKSRRLSITNRYLE